MKIGFFDSGLGGLLVMKAVSKALPTYDYEYYGDTKNLPYGDKSENQIYELTKAGVEQLFKKNCVLVIIACNTASSETLRRLQDEYLTENYPDRRILGVIIPVIEEVVLSGAKRVIMFATKRTVSSGKYHLELGKRNVIDTKIEAEATPELVPLLELGEIETAVNHTTSLINERLERGEGVDGVILGCTHYNLMLDSLRKNFGDKIKFFSQTEIIPFKLKQYLHDHQELEKRLTRGGDRNIFLTEHRADYDKYLADFLGGHLIARE